MKKAIITSALPYANGEIHLGHVASTYLPADVTARFLRQNGTEVYYVCASDDFGTPILIQSEKEGRTPQEYVAHWNKRDREDFEALNIRFDAFCSTSSEENRGFARYVFEKLDRAGHIYKRDIIQFFCENDAKFLPDRYVKGTCPYCRAEDQYSDLCERCGRVPEEIDDPKCAICGRKPVKKSTTHHFFRLKNFEKKLEEWLASNSNLQPDVKRYVQNWIRAGLIDWDITRDIEWGVPIPGTDSQVFYGWFDNHLAYISTAVKLLESMGVDGKRFWNESDIYHFIGKDIVYHHYLFLPAMRMGIANEYKLPDYMPTRGHLTLQNKKISKSRNWYIGLREFLRLYPADYLRYYMISINPYSQDDMNFDWNEFVTRINSELIGNLGNFANRALGFAEKQFDRTVPAPAEYDEMDRAAESRIQNVTEVEGLMRQNHLDRSLRKIMDFAGGFNQYFQHKEPWKREASTCLYLSINAARALAILLYPFLPASSKELWTQVGMDGGPDVPWSSIPRMLRPGHRLGRASPLFAKIDAKDAEGRQKRMGK